MLLGRNGPLLCGMISARALIRLTLSLALSLLPVLADGCLEDYTCEMSHEKQVVTCTESKIDEVPLCLHPRLLRLSLHKTGIKTLYLTSFIYYVYLRYVNISENKIENIENKTFEFQSKLEELYLADNKISRLEPNTFFGLKNLTILSLKGNLLEEIPDSVFRHLSRLDHLDLSHNRLTSLKEHSLQGVPRLTVLLLSGNRLSLMPAASIAILPHLAELSLGGNVFQSIERGHFKGLSALTSLDLSQTNFSGGIPADGLREISQLRVLKLEDCRLQEVPTDLLEEVPRLEELYLSRNLFTSMDRGALRGNEQLQVLTLTGCPNLKRISEGSLERNINLRQVDLSRNAQLTYLPGKDFHFLVSLSFLDLHGNNLQYIPDDLLSWGDVKELLLHDNPLVCNCSAFRLRDHLIKGNNSDTLLTCALPPDLKGILLTSTKLTDKSCGIGATTQGIVIAISVCGLIICVGCVAFVLLYKNRSSCIRQLLKGHKLGRGRSATHRSYDSEYPYMKPVPVTEL